MVTQQIDRTKLNAQIAHYQDLAFDNKPLQLRDFNGDKVEFYKYLCVKNGLVKGPMLIKGPPRSGKTTWAIHHSRFLREHFGIAVTMDFVPVNQYGTNEYGEYDFFDENVLKAEMEKVTTLAKGDKGSWKVTDEKENRQELTLAAKTLKIYKRTVVLDEATRWLSKYKMTSNVSFFIMNLIKQWGHYDTLLMFLNHYEAELNPDARRYFDDQGIIINCSWGCKWKDTGEYQIRNNMTGAKMYMTLYGPNVFQYFNSFNPIAMPGRIKL
jgi:hypothetical protein